jgi:hypothetical protein
MKQGGRCSMPSQASHSQQGLQYVRSSTCLAAWHAILLLLLPPDSPLRCCSGHHCCSNSSDEPNQRGPCAVADFLQAYPVNVSSGYQWGSGPLAALAWGWNDVACNSTAAFMCKYLPGGRRRGGVRCCRLSLIMQRACCLRTRSAAARMLANSWPRPASDAFWSQDDSTRHSSS